jgi:LuxR family transcriptional regulator, maltose regulon positive regulatory protein
VLGERTIAASDWTYSRARDLLFYLATEGAASREEISLVFWPDASPEQLRRNLGVTLHHLRKALGRNEWVIFDKEIYRFNRSLGHWYDVETFTALHQQAQQSTTSILLLQQALALFQGEFLADASVGEWYMPLRERLAQQYVELIFALAQRHWAAGDYSAAAAVYRQTISHDPYLEAAYRELMGCLAQMGERAQALRVYTELARMMKQEFASLPSPETQALYEHLRAG